MKNGLLPPEELPQGPPKAAKPGFMTDFLKNPLTSLDRSLVRFQSDHKLRKSNKRGVSREKTIDFSASKETLDQKPNEYYIL